MSRIRVDLPPAFAFETNIDIRITEINYGGHVGNHHVLAIIHEARVRYLQHHGFEELNIEGLGLIMSDVTIEFKKELFYGDTVRACVAASGFTRVSFDLYYNLQKESGGKMVSVAVAKTGMVCYDYARKKIAALPEKVKSTLS